jgi:hypothetical protein
LVKRSYLALCVSTRMESWPLSEIPFYCLADPKYFPRSRSKERVDYLAEKWNQCHEAGLQLFPNATHIVNVGSYYLAQISSLRHLINKYDELDCNIILSGNVWARIDQVLPYKTTYDTWACPDLAGFTWRVRRPNGLVQVSSVAMPCIYPVEAWRVHRFHNPESVDDGIWYNTFCNESGLPVFVDLSIDFYRSKHDSDIVQLPFTKQLRIALGIRKRLRKKISRRRANYHNALTS